MQVFEYMGEHDNAVLEPNKYRNVMRDFSNKVIGHGKTPLELMQEYSPYDNDNKDCWYNLSVAMKPFLQVEQKLERFEMAK